MAQVNVHTSQTFLLDILRCLTRRGLRRIVPADTCGSYFPHFHETALAMISAQVGIFGCVTTEAAVARALGMRA